MASLVDAVADLGAGGSRPVVIACWQDEAYLDVPPGLLDRLARVADLSVACVGRPHLTMPADHVPLEGDEPLASEWSVVAVTPTCGLALVANEVRASLPATTVEGGRAFRYDATDDPRVVVAHARRLLRSFGARMTPDAAARLAGATTDFDSEADMVGHLDLRVASVHAAITAADDQRREHAELPADAGGLAGLAAWLADAGPRAPSLGMVVVRSEVRGVAAQLREHAARLGRVGDIVVDVPPDAAMLVLPGLSGEALGERAEEVEALLAGTLGTDAVDALAVDVPAEHARRDLVGNLGEALARLRARAHAGA